MESTESMTEELSVGDGMRRRDSIDSMIASAVIPHGLLPNMTIDIQGIGTRIYLLDNSGSVMVEDGTILDEQHDTLREGTRWSEICHFARCHAHWNLMLGTPCYFMVLNPRVQPFGMSQRQLYIDPRAELSEAEHLRNLHAFLEKNTPFGLTPLCLRLADVRRLVEGFADLEGRKVFVVVVTDGIPTAMSGSDAPEDTEILLNELRSLTDTGVVRMVIRLCTDDQETIDFYNNLDAEGNLPIDVLDDIRSEAQEVNQMENNFFAYTALIHRIREAGTLSSVFNSMDDRRLDVEEVRALARMLLEEPEDGRLLSDAELVEKALARQSEGLVFDAMHLERRPVVVAAFGLTNTPKSGAPPSALADNLHTDDELHTAGELRTADGLRPDAVDLTMSPDGVSPKLDTSAESNEPRPVVDASETIADELRTADELRPDGLGQTIRPD
eukprot:CAMPEP_0176167990 /NCGR_PEP_ID=MMETSP0120_2-20121206/85972_1 /TAXON_ID=160619 /ORGANISM="Kryptoperidinium foliaceum, Strain CCMP 1326" /LENGTH=441 /DNA_ID=CAMNT_0017505677 /DNA_START=36 /DNA_END=1358 /DNA_ORIENTATION=-